MAKSVGIDLGSHSLKILGLDTSGKRFKISSFFNHPNPSTPEEGTVSHLITSTFKENKLPRDMVVMGFDAYTSIIRELSVPFKNPDQIRKIIKYESEGHLFSFGIDEVIIDFVKVRENADTSDLIVFGVVKDILREKIRTVEEAYVDPLSADIDLLAHYNSLSLTPYMEEHPTLALLDIGFQSTKILVVSEGRPILLRGMRGGMSSIINAIKQETDSTLPAAEEKVRLRLPEIAGSLPGSDGGEELVVVVQDDEDLPESSDMDRGREDLENEFLADRVTTLRTKIVRELNRSLARLKTDKPVDCILLTGGGSLIPGLGEEITRSLNITARPFDILDHVDHTFTDEERARVEPFISVSIGLALKQLGKDASGTEFRREELAFQKRFEQIKVPLTLCLIFLLMFLSLVFYRFRSSYKLRSQEHNVITWQVVNAIANIEKVPEFEKYMDQNNMVQTDKIRGPRLKRHKKIYGEARDIREAMDREMGQTSSDMKHYCALETWNELFSRIGLMQKMVNPAGTSPIITKLNIDQRNGVVCNLFLRDFNNGIEALQKAFEESDLLEMQIARAADTDLLGTGNPNPKFFRDQKFTYKNKPGKP